MPLPATGQISLDQISNEFGDIIPGGDFLSEYYGVASTIPRTGNPISFSDFYGAVNLQMNVAYANSNPNLELVASNGGRPYVPAEQVLITTSTASEFGYSQSGSSRGYSTWYKGGAGPYFQIGNNIRSSSAPISTPIPEQLTSSNAGLHGYSVTNEYDTNGYRKWTVSGGEGWQHPSNGFLYTRTESTQFLTRQTIVDSSNRTNANFWNDGIAYIYSGSGSQDVNGYYQWRKNGVYYYSTTDTYLRVRTPSTTVVDVTPTNAPQMGYTKTSPTVTVDGHDEWTKGGVKYWEKNNLLYTRDDTVISKTDLYDVDDYWEIEQVGGTNPFKLTVSMNGITDITYHSTEPTITTKTIDGITVTRGTQRTGQAWAYDYELSNSNNEQQYWKYERAPAGAPNIFGTPTVPDPEDGKIYVVRPGGFGIPQGGLWGVYRDGARDLTQITLSGVTYKRGSFQVSESPLSSGLYDNSFYSLGIPYTSYPANWGISASGTNYTYDKKRDSLTTYTYGNPIEDTEKYSQTVISYSSNPISSTRFEISYNYSDIYETRAEVLGISSTPQFTYDDARERLYRASTTSLSYDQKSDWPAAPAASFNWRFNRTIANYYLQRMEIDGVSIVATGIETLTPTGSLISSGNNTPQQLTLTPNAEADPTELTDFFFTLYRNDSTSANPFNLGYVSPLGSNYPTLSISGNTLTLGNLPAGGSYFRLRWEGFQNTLLSVAGATASESGVSSEFQSSPTLTLSGGDNGRLGMDFILEKKESTSPEVWAVIRCFEFFNGLSTPIVGCDFLDFYATGRN